MAPQVVKDFVALVSAHPILFGMSLILFTPPFFPIVKFFSPLLISTALFMLALFTMGPKSDGDGSEGERDKDWEGSSEADGGDGEGVIKRRRPDGGWMDWVKSIEESSISFMSPRAKLKRENWKGGAVNDENASILEDASWAKGGDFSSYEQGDSGVTEEESSASRLMQENVGNSFMPTLIAPSMLFKVDSSLKAAAERSIYDDMDLGEDGPEDDAPELEDVEEPEQHEQHEQPGTPAPETEESSHQSPGHGVQHQPLENLQIPNRVAAEDSESDSPYTDLDSSSDLDRSKRFMFANVRKNSANANSGLSVNSDGDTPVAEKLTLSGKFHQMEKLSDFIDDSEHAEKTGQESPELNVLQPTTDEQVEAVKAQLESFVQDDKPKEEKAEGSPSPPKPDDVVKKSVSEDEKTPETPAPKAAEPKGEISEVQ
ncbi:hypothetical protein KC19_3G254400 [Ceratodon purpureus]|uniref:Uncharacterized protein n=1 Tax=Ceratodon purpureus TaxID=3225 RepID=A0A8T0IPX8_CERPU|nr:hypothetical protein KC19_3G254400 [Ceratodon purpureus]